jgi:3'-phosphoadenosine 5'-phosphosulfate sulfotransferase (PAPS reductase)/FAD synthetase
MTYLPKPIAISQDIASAISQGARVIFNLSGGKDSAAALIATSDYLDSVGHPKHLRSCIHADLGDIEWPMTLEFVRQTAERFDLPLDIVRRAAGGLIDRWYQRFDAAKRRYEALETYCLIGPWSSASLRFCTSETKVAPISSFTNRVHKGERVIHVIGLRRQESANRAKAPIWRVDPKSSARTPIYHLHPIIDWDVSDVYDVHSGNQIPLHPAYVRFNSTRLSCSFCILASGRDLAASIHAKVNQPSLERIVALELASTFSFQPGRWLADFAQSSLPENLASGITLAQVRAQDRKCLEAGLPKDLRFQKGWPPRIPSIAEARSIARVRARILDHHGLANRFQSAGQIRDQFAQLHANIQKTA